MLTFGISPYHDSSVCLLKNGSIENFYKEERITRKKRDSYPFLSISESLKNINSLDAIAYCPPIKHEDSFKLFVNYISKFANCENILDFSDQHHLQHASLAFYNSGFENAAVIVIDRNGSDLMNSARESESIFMASYPSNFTEIYKSYWMYNNYAHEAIRIKQSQNNNCEFECKSGFGIVKVYETATSLIMQHALENGKTMGLSAYGDKDKKFNNLFMDNTNIPIDFYFSHVNLYGDYEAIYSEYENYIEKNVSTENFKFYADYAWQVQNQTQHAASKLIDKAISNGAKNICLTGGYALNIVANSYFLKKYPNIKFYFEPIADDSGNSIGGAMLAYRIISEDTNIYKIKDTFIHGENELINDEKLLEISEDEIVKSLLKNETVAIFSGKAEGGPRALGNRSILFYPNLKNSKEIINEIKHREWYRPFAASVLEEDFDKLFYPNNYYDEFMTISFDAKDITKVLFPGIVHVDNTCRIQLVNENSPLYSLLKKIKKENGYGILLNTSFNEAGKPLVNSWNDAKEMFFNSNINILWNRDLSKGIKK